MSKKNVIIVLGSIAVLLIIGFLITKPKNSPDTKNTNSQNSYSTSSSSQVTITPQITPMPTPTPNPEAKVYQVLLSTTVGDITLELSDKTPITTNNFVTLAKKGFYDKTIFHRVINGFMIQGGDPEGTGRGGPGYKFADEPFTGEYTRGTIAMANAGPNTNGSQFFIMHKDNPLPKNYVIFGKVIKGIETVDKIAQAEVSLSEMGERSKPVTPVSILKATVLE